MKKLIAAIFAAGFASSVSAAPVNPSTLTADIPGCSSISGSSITLVACAANSPVTEFSGEGTATLSFTTSGSGAFFASIVEESLNFFEFFNGTAGGAGSLSLSIPGTERLYFQLNSDSATVTFSNIDFSFTPLGGGGVGAGGGEAGGGGGVGGEVAADVPAPGTIALLGLGLAGFGIRGLRKEK
jgi:hypothetical protein